MFFRRVACIIFSAVLLAPSTSISVGAETRIKCSYQKYEADLQIIGTPSIEKGVTLKGDGFCSDYKRGGSGAATIAIKINDGAVSHINSTINANRSIWYIIDDADAQTGSFLKTIPLPDDSKKGFQASTGAFDIHNFSIRALAGTLSPHAIPQSVFVAHQEDFIPRKEKRWREESDFAKRLGDIVVDPDNVNHEITVHTPTLEPGDWVYAAVFYPFKGDKCDTIGYWQDFGAWYSGPYSPFPNIVTNRRVSKDRTITLPLLQMAHHPPLDQLKKNNEGQYEAMAPFFPYGFTFLTVDKVVKNPNPNEDHDIHEVVGAAKITNTIKVTEKIDANGYTVYDDLTPVIYKGWRRDLVKNPPLYTHVPDGYVCTFPKSYFDNNPASVFAKSPRVSKDGTLRVPTIKGIEYSINGKAVSGIIQRHSSQDYVETVIAKPLPGYRLAGHDAGQSQRFTVNVPYAKGKTDEITVSVPRPGDDEKSPRPSILRPLRLPRHLLRKQAPVRREKGFLSRFYQR